MVLVRVSQCETNEKNNNWAWFGSATFDLTSKWIGVDRYTV